MPKKILFYRDYRGFTGGHLKVYHYFEHFRSFPEFTPCIFFSAETRRDRGNPWAAKNIEPVSKWLPENFDVLFLAGTDWNMLSPEVASSPGFRVLNLIQGLRHSDPGSKLRSFLKFPAIRICVSQQVADAIVETGEVNGPVHVIPNGIEDIRARSQDANLESYDILIIGRKNPVLANRLHSGLRRLYSCLNLPSPVPRDELLALMQRSRVTVCLPERREGFYLPALEAMSVGSLVVCPDCVGNRDFCRDGWNMLRPDFDAADMERTLQAAMRMPASARAALLENAKRTAARHTLVAEREKLRRILDQYAAFSGMIDKTKSRNDTC